MSKQVVYSLGTHQLEIPDDIQAEWVLVVVRDCIQETFNELGIEVIDSHNSGIKMLPTYWKLSARWNNFKDRRTNNAERTMGRTSESSSESEE